MEGRPTQADGSIPVDTRRSSLGRANAILAVFDANPTLSLSEIVARTGLPKTTVYRAVEKMIELGWLRREQDRYSIGARLFEVASSSQPRVTLHQLTRSHLPDVGAATNETVHLAVLDGPYVRCVEKMPGNRSSANTRIGGRMPAYCTAAGKALLAFGPATALDLVVRSGLTARTPATITREDQLLAELARIRIDGVAFDREECEIGIACVAAPVRGPNDDCVAAMAIAGHAPMLRLDRLARAVRATALDASRALRARPTA